LPTSILKFLEYNRLGLIGSIGDALLLFAGLGLRAIFFALPFLLLVKLPKAFDIGLLIVFFLAIAAETSAEKKLLSNSSCLRKNIARLVAVVMIPLTSLVLLVNAIGQDNKKIEFYGIYAIMVWLSIISLESSKVTLADKPKS
jgi:hypothetical protein